MVSSKVKSKTVKKPIKSKPKSTKKSSKKVIKDKPIVEDKLSLLTKAGITGLGALGTIGAGYLLNKEVIPYLSNNYGVYPLIYPKLYKQFIEKDREELSTPSKPLTFRTYIDNEYYKIRDNYQSDKKNGKIKAYNDNHQNTQKITRMYDYMKKNGIFDTERPSERKFSSIENLAE